MSAIAFSSHGLEFEIDKIGGRFSWWHILPNGDMNGAIDFLTADDAKADAEQYAARIATGTVPGNREE